MYNVAVSHGMHIHTPNYNSWVFKILFLSPSNFKGQPPEIPYIQLGLLKNVWKAWWLVPHFNAWGPYGIEGYPFLTLPSCGSSYWLMSEKTFNFVRCDSLLIFVCTICIRMDLIPLRSCGNLRPLDPISNCFRTNFVRNLNFYCKVPNVSFPMQL